jgi:integrase/recombinase XerC
MARKPQVRYFESRGAYYTQHEGKQHRLAAGPDDAPSGPTYLEALSAFRGLMEMGNVHRAGGGNKVGVILAQYLLHIQMRRRESTLRIRKSSLKDFVARWGELEVAQLKHSHVYEFLAGQDRWGDGGTRICLAGLQAAFNWAVKAGLIPHNPLKGVETPAPRSRSRECLVTPEEHARMLALATVHLRPLLVCLENTGARPGELISATAADWNGELGALVYYPDTTRAAGEFGHKTSKKKERVILFTGEALDAVRKLVAARPTGALFRTRLGHPWTGDALRERFQHLRGLIGANPLITPYSYRHVFATNWLKAGRSIDQLAALLGNTPTVIRHHYSHLLGDAQGLRAELEKFRQGQTPPASQELKLHEPGEGVA